MIFIGQPMDACKYNNGGCDPNADCTQRPKCGTIVCTCKIGYTNVFEDGKLSCKGT